MSIGDLPTFAKASHSHTAYGLGDLSNANTFAGTTSIGNALGALGGFQFQQAGNEHHNQPQAAFAAQAALSRNVSERRLPPTPNKEPAVTLRFVQVFIADTNENIPLDKRLLYTGSQKLTDATDQELFYEIEIKALLDAHNVLRTTLINKKVKDRTEYLEPARIRDLKMIVVDIAAF